jgi:uncharacterized protein YbjT (DUF2867 family)
MTGDRTILITGVTGHQGGAVAQALQGTGFSLRGLTRKPDSERAAALARHGVDVVKGGLRFPSHVILRPVFFMENLLAPFSLQGSTLAWALGPGTKLQMIAVDDIGWFGARAFADAAALNRREIDIAGDVRTMPEAAGILTAALGRPIAFAQTPIEQVRQYSKDMAVMLEWFERVGYSADIAGLEREFGGPLTTLPDWARRQTRGERA